MLASSSCLDSRQMLGFKVIKSSHIFSRTTSVQFVKGLGLTTALISMLKYCKTKVKYVFSPQLIPIFEYDVTKLMLSTFSLKKIVKKTFLTNVLNGSQALTFCYNI